MNDERKAYFAGLLRGAGFKATPRRREILRVLEGAGKPLSVSEILERTKGIVMNPATAYRAVKELKEADIIRAIDLQQGFAAYELAGQQDHHHLVCTSCRRVEDFTGCHFEAITRTALKQSRQFKEVTQHSLELFGLCKACAK